MNAAHHYDISDELYDLFLDSKRQYSCAYFKNNREQTVNDKLCAVRKAFDDTGNLISALHSFKSVENENYKRLLPPLTLLSTEKQKELLNKLKELNFIPRKNIAA